MHCRVKNGWRRCEIISSTLTVSSEPRRSTSRTRGWRARKTGRASVCLGGNRTRPEWVSTVISVFRYDRNPTLADRFGKAAIVAKVLVGVFNRELAHRVVERRIGVYIASNPRRVAGSRMRPCKRPGAELAEFLQGREVPVFRDRRDFCIAKLAEVIVAANHSARPAQENVAPRLHETLARPKPLAMVL